MDSGKDAGTKDREPVRLTADQVRLIHQEAFSLLAKRFMGTRLAPIFLEEHFTGKVEERRTLGRNFEVQRTENDFGDEIILTSTKKRSDRQKGSFAGDIFIFRRPSSLSSSDPYFEHRVLLIDGTTTQSAPGNTDVNAEAGMTEIRRIGKIPR